MECLPPTFTTHSFASYAERNSRLCQAQIASRRGMMPAVEVYLVLFSSMALMAAFLMWSGVGKSGSPGPKSAMSTPRDFNFSASAMTADVGEIWMRLMRSVRCTISPSQLLLGGDCQIHCFDLGQTLVKGGGEPFAPLLVAQDKPPHPKLRNLRTQSFFDDCRHQTLERRAEPRNFTHQLGPEIAV